MRYLSLFFGAVALLLQTTASAQFMTGFWQPQITIKFTSSQPSLVASTCSSGFGVQTANVAAVGANIAFALTANLTSTGSAVFYSDPGCTQSITSLSYPALSAFNTFYVMDLATEAFTITISIAGIPPLSMAINSTVNNFIWKGITSSNWATGSNWSGGVVPSTSDYTVFDGSCTNCSPTFTGAVDVKGIRTNPGYTGTIAQGSYDMTIRSGGLSLSAGTFTGATSAANTLTIISAHLVVGGGSFTAPTGYTIIHGGFRVLGSGTATFAATSTLDFECGSTTYTACYSAAVLISSASTLLGNVIFHGRGTNYTLLTDMTAAGSLTFGDLLSTSNTKLTGSSVYVYGPSITVDNLGEGSGNSTFVVAKGNVSGQTITNSSGALMPPLQIDSGIYDVTLSGLIKTSYYAATSVGTFTSTGSTLTIICVGSGHADCYGASETLNFGGLTYNNLEIYGYTTTYDFSGSTAYVTGTFSFGDNNSNSRTFSNGAIWMYGQVVNNVLNGYRSQTNFTLYIKGNAAGQTLNGNTNYYPQLNIDAGANAVTLSGLIKIHSYTMTSVGTFTVTGSTLQLECGSGISGCYNTNEIINLGNLTYNNLIFHGYVTGIDLGGSTATVTGTFSLGDLNSTSRAITNGTIIALGDVTLQNNGYRGVGLIKVAGNAAGQTITGIAAKDMPSLEIAAGTNPVTFSGTLRPAAFTMTSVGTFTTTGTLLELVCFNGATCYNTTQALNLGTAAYNDVSIHGYDTSWDLTGTNASVNGTLLIGDAAGSQYMRNGIINAYGNVSADNAFGDYGTTKIILKGNAAGQILTGAANKNFPSLEIDTGTKNVTLSGIIHTAIWAVTSVGAMTTTGSTLDLTCQSQTECFNTTVNVKPGSVVYNNVNLRGARTNWDLGGGTFNVGGLLTIGDQSSGGKTISNGSLSLAGGITNLNNGNVGTVTTTFIGSAAQVITPTSTTFPTGAITVSPSGTGTVSLAAATTYSAGTNMTITSGSLMMTGFTLTVPGTVTINSGATLNEGGGTLIKGALVNNGTIIP